MYGYDTSSNNEITEEAESGIDVDPHGLSGTVERLSSKIKTVQMRTDELHKKLESAGLLISRPEVDHSAKQEEPERPVQSPMASKLNDHFKKLHRIQTHLEQLIYNLDH